MSEEQTHVASTTSSKGNFTTRMLGLLFKEDLVLPDGDDASRCDALVKHNGDLKALLKTSTQEITTRDGATFDFFFSFPFFFFEFEFESASA